MPSPLSIVYHSIAICAIDIAAQTAGWNLGERFLKVQGIKNPALMQFNHSPAACLRAGKVFYERGKPDRQRGKPDAKGGKFSYSLVAVVDFDTFGEYNVTWKSELRVYLFGLELILDNDGNQIEVETPVQYGKYHHRHPNRL